MTNPDATLDARGLSCPLPIVKARLEMDKLEPGQVLLVEATDPGSKSDFAQWSKMSGHEILEQSENEGLFRYTIRKAG